MKINNNNNNRLRFQINRAKGHILVRVKGGLLIEISD
jgi:hypothetical protein